MKKILIVDDEVMTLELMNRILTKENFEIIPARSAKEAISLMDNLTIDGVLLDVGLPDQNGFEVLKHIRASSQLKHLPVLMVTARDDEIDMIIGLEIGADDYIIKPIRKRELVARIRSVFRRIESDKEFVGNVFEIGPIKVFLDHHNVFIKDKQIEMGQKEFKLLVTLMQSPGKIFSRDELLDIVWHKEAAIEERTVDVHIRRIRGKIEPNPNKPIWIETVRGIGYRFTV